MHRRIFIALLPLLIACDRPAEPTGAPKRPVAVGEPAPDVTLALQDGKKLQLSSLKGNLVLLYFYPKDDTPG